MAPSGPRRRCAGAADLAPTTGGQRLDVDLTSVTDPGTLADALASILEDDAARIRTLLVGAEGTVKIASSLEPDQAVNVQDAIDAGELPVLGSRAATWSRWRPRRASGCSTRPT